MAIKKADFWGLPLDIVVYWSEVGPGISILTSTFVFSNAGVPLRKSTVGKFCT